MRLVVSGLALLVGAGAYGYAIGSAHSEIYAWRNVLKLPMLLVGTGVVCALSYWISGRFLGARIGFRETQRLAFALFRDLSVLLLSLAPPVCFIGWILRRHDDDQLGEYGLFLGLNVVFVALAGSVALVRQGRALLVRLAVPRVRAMWIVVMWLGLTLCVGGQLAFYLRPFFGLPASRGNVPPFALGDEADVRGARNFYEAVGQVITRPPLPSSWRRGGSG